MVKSTKTSMYTRCRKPFNRQCSRTSRIVHHKTTEVFSTNEASNDKRNYLLSAPGELCVSRDRRGMASKSKRTD